MFSFSEASQQELFASSPPFQRRIDNSYLSLFFSLFFSFVSVVVDAVPDIDCIGRTAAAATAAESRRRRRRRRSRRRRRAHGGIQVRNQS
jgi:hypothetical protein